MIRSRRKHIRILALMMITVAGCATGGAAPARAQQIPAAEPVRGMQFPDYLGMIMERFFGKEKEDGPRPEETLVAPFVTPPEGAEPAATDGVVFKSADGYNYRRYTGEDGKTYVVPDYAPDELTPGQELAQPHLSPEHVADWLMRATAEIFTMDSQNYRAHMAHLATGMSEAGLADFNKFLADANIMVKLQQDGMQLRGFVEEPPLLLNEGALAGRHRWLFEMPVVVTFMPRDTQSYARIENPESQSLHFIVQAQVGRVEKGPGPENVMIETWKVRANPQGRGSLPRN